MLSTWHKTFRIAFVGLLAVASAAFFYLSGLGTGLYVARTSEVSQVGVEIEHESPTKPVLTVPGPTPPPTVALSPLEGTEDAFSVFWEAWHILVSEFYGDLPTEQELPYKAIQGVIDATDDPYTAFLDPTQAEILRTDLSGSFEGIGATVRLGEDGSVEVVQPLAGWPAIEAGLRAGDAILEVDGVDIQGMSLYEAIALIRGPAGTTVRLLVRREGVKEPFSIEIQRTRIELAVVEYRMLDNDIAYIRLTEYGQTATEELVEALDDLNADQARGLILDLRGNRGGYLSAAIEVTSQFIDRGDIVIERFRDGREVQHKAIPGGKALDVPLVVLIDSASASASEITAGAVQDTKRGMLIGTTTLGKGSVQVAHTLSDNSELRVTIARWFTPNGRGIHQEGIEPDIAVEISQDDLAQGRDPQLDRAIRYLLEGN